MGVYSSTFHKSGGQILIDSTAPSQANWITTHADACKMTVPEVQRCWARFQMLQPEDSGNIPLSYLLRNDAFSKQLIQQMPATEDNLVTFQTYCSALSWLSRASMETKLRGWQEVGASLLDSEHCICISENYGEKKITYRGESDSPG
ncbi:uncharacterized protein LOC106706775 [Latimeria chalumnae]|uniref:uncharacterized protein LOC106706775 n=1 Tax=Latimeria chalumnae TaxID=7897 RepID=UPI00313A95CC